MSAFTLSLSTKIVADESLLPIRHGADILRRDMREVLTDSGPDNVIRLVLDHGMAAESYTVHVAPEEITLTCGDDLGAVYAMLSVSEKCLGIKPLGWWMGLRPEKQDTISVSCQGWQSPAYAVRYRCWFINDEVLLTGWHTEESQRAAVWKQIYETILRCGGNMVIPGTDREFDGQKLNEMALERGLWITQHHTELLGARMFARAYPGLQASYTRYPELFEGLWREAIERYAGKRVVWTIGFRGQGDKAFWHDDTGYDTAEKQGAFISMVMRRQMEMVLQMDPGARFSTNLYGEMMALYRQGYLRIPEGVIKLWGDNGYGKMVSRRQNNDNPRTDAMPGNNETGENGIYYHISFYDLQAANHITMLQNPPQMIADELKHVLDRHADALWNINVGSIKPHLFMLEILRHMWMDGVCDVAKAANQFAADYYGSINAAPVLTEYADHAVPYGPHEDDRAGDQFYHFPLRSLARSLLRGETDKPLGSLLWAANGSSFSDQVQHLGKIAEKGSASWNAYLQLCQKTSGALSGEAAQRLRDSIYLQGIIHQTGCDGLYSFCQACMHALKGNDLQAYLWADRALQAHRKALSAMRSVQGRFAHIYDNDCFAGVGLTVQVLESVRSWLRVRGDGDMLYNWEKQYLTPAEENLVMLQTHRTAQLGDDELCLRLRGEIPLAEAF